MNNKVHNVLLFFNLLFVVGCAFTSGLLVKDRIEPYFDLDEILYNIEIKIHGGYAYENGQVRYISRSKVYLSDDLKIDFNELFLDNENEWSACIDGNMKTIFDEEGEVDYHEYTINDFSDLIISNYTSRTYSPDNCEFGKIHSHPDGTCEFSHADTLAFKYQHKKNGILVDLVMCGEDSFAYQFIGDYGAKILKV